MNFRELIESTKIQFLTKEEGDIDILNQIMLNNGLSYDDWKASRVSRKKFMVDSKLDFFDVPPDLYLKTIKGLRGDADKVKLDNVRDLVNKGVKFPYPWLDFSSALADSLGQDGRHRVEIAKELGMKKVRIIVAYKDDTLPKEYKKFKVK